MAKPSFVNLWNSYPDHTVRQCDDGYANECAIRLSITLNTEKTLTVSKTTYSEPKCSHCHARGAESLANWLYVKLGPPKIYKDGAAAKRELASKKGVIFFKDCFVRAGEKRQIGDHIDLWWTGMTCSYDDPGNKAKQVWFWELS
jgi:hypothetical protein